MRNKRLAHSATRPRRARQHTRTHARTLAHTHAHTLAHTHARPPARSLARPASPRSLSPSLARTRSHDRTLASSLARSPARSFKFTLTLARTVARSLARLLAPSPARTQPYHPLLPSRIPSGGGSEPCACPSVSAPAVNDRRGHEDSGGPVPPAAFTNGRCAPTMGAAAVHNSRQTSQKGAVRAVPVAGH